jgi:sugar transferase (PEP-CTERM/EpsH1 system associated)
MPNLLFLTQRIPYPPNKGEKIRSLQIIRHLSRNYNVHLGCLLDDPADEQHIGAVQALCAGSHFARLNRKRAKLLCLVGLLTGKPLSVTFYHDRALAAWVSKTIQEIRPEVIFISSSNMAPYVLDLTGTERVCLCDLVDVDSEKWRSYARSGKGPMHWIHAREGREIAKLEARIARECDWSTFVSNEEAELFRREQPDFSAKIRAIPNGVDYAYFDPEVHHDTPFATGRLNFVFTGTMDYPPNIDAVRWFVSEIFPIIRRIATDAQFHIVGSSPAPQVRELAAVDGVSVTGWVPDVRPYVAHATASVAPMRIARGIQNKVLEAMAMARPVVVTKDALEGIEAEPGRELLLAEGAEAFAASCLFAAQPEGQMIGQAARRRVERDYAWASRLQGFDALLMSAPS